MRFEPTRCRWLPRALRLVLAVGLALAPAVAFAADRVALVVGNSAYAAIGALPNPGNDATDVAAALRRLGFDVTPVLDADRVSMSEALRVFTRKSAGADVSLVFYARHGLEMDGVKYLVPVDAQLERDTDLRFEAVELDDVLAATIGAGLRIVILDACRNNPLARSMQRTGASRNVSRGSFGELDENLLGDETLVAYAAAAGTTAADGPGRNSPYTTALLEYLEQPLEIGILFREVRGRVLEETGGEQRAHEYASLLGEHYLRSTSGPGTVTVAAGASTDTVAQLETVFWQSIAQSSDPADFEAYLEQFPAGVFARLARNRMRALAGAPADAPAVSRPRPGADLPAAADRPGAMAPGTEFRDCDNFPEMVVVPAGTSRMGCASGSDDCQDAARPVRTVDVASFALGKYEVTRAEFAEFVSATGHVARGCRAYVWTDPAFAGPRWEWKDRGQASWRQPEFDQQETEPVVCVNWQDASAYVRWLSDESGREYGFRVRRSGNTPREPRRRQPSTGAMPTPTVRTPRRRRTSRSTCGRSRRRVPGAGDDPAGGAAFGRAGGPAGGTAERTRSGAGRDVPGLPLVSGDGGDFRRGGSGWAACRGATTATTTSFRCTRWRWPRSRWRSTR